MSSSKLVNMVNKSKYISGTRAPEIGVAFAESYFLRKLLMPILVPAKLWLSYRLVLGLKREQTEATIDPRPVV